MRGQPSVNAGSTWGQPAAPYRGCDTALPLVYEVHRVAVLALGVHGRAPQHLEAGAYTRPLLSSTRAVSEIKAHPKRPSTPPDTGKHPPTTPYVHPLSHTKARTLS
jgi:hypothetical protein